MERYRIIEHDATHYDIEQWVQTETGEWLWAVIACVQDETIAARERIAS